MFEEEQSGETGGAVANYRGVVVTPQSRHVFLSSQVNVDFLQLACGARRGPGGDGFAEGFSEGAPRTRLKLIRQLYP